MLKRDKVTTSLYAPAPTVASEHFLLCQPTHAQQFDLEELATLYTDLLREPSEENISAAERVTHVAWAAIKSYLESRVEFSLSEHERLLGKTRGYVLLQPNTLFVAAIPRVWLALAYSIQQDLLHANTPASFTTTTHINIKVLKHVIQHILANDQDQAARTPAAIADMYLEQHSAWRVPDGEFPDCSRVMQLARQVQEAVLPVFDIASPGTDLLYPFAVRYVCQVIDRLVNIVMWPCVSSNEQTAADTFECLLDSFASWVADGAPHNIINGDQYPSSLPAIQLALPLRRPPAVQNSSVVRYLSNAADLLCELKSRHVVASAEVADLQRNLGFAHEQLAAGQHHANTLQGLAEILQRTTPSLARTMRAMRGTVAQQQRVIEQLLQQIQPGEYGAAVNEQQALRRQVRSLQAVIDRMSAIPDLAASVEALRELEQQQAPEVNCDHDVEPEQQHQIEQAAEDACNVTSSLSEFLRAVLHDVEHDRLDTADFDHLGIDPVDLQHVPRNLFDAADCLGTPYAPPHADDTDRRPPATFHSAQAAGAIHGSIRPPTARLVSAHAEMAAALATPTPVGCY
jgi:hypothetical protein